MPFSRYLVKQHGQGTQSAQATYLMRKGYLIWNTFMILDFLLCFRLCITEELFSVLCCVLFITKLSQFHSPKLG